LGSTLNILEYEYPRVIAGVGLAVIVILPDPEQPILSVTI
jgi:hypothetical protein